MAIRQTANNGIPLIDGIFYPQTPLYVPYSLRIIENRRVLVSGTGKQTMPYTQRYFYYYTDEISFGSDLSETLVRFGYLRHINCGAVMAFNVKRDQLIWLASFSYAAAFERGSLHGTKLLLQTDDNELWQFDLKNPRSIGISILPQADRIIRTK